ncbi:gp159 [Bacillus phage G]|uniref:Gp159 n=1 Tax=Bacillus phage G TaxID=2884420 RepID=G3MBM5_9CAUD|nr:gp159 [Bacillus phage G]AEO93419.1 gp159 [Bacillus phage G]
MSKKLNWLDKFAQEQAEKQTMKKVASTKKVANQIIVSPEDVPSAEEGSTIEFNGEQFKVVDANFSDEVGPGVVLERAAAYENLQGNPMDVSMGTQSAGMVPASNNGQQYHYDLNNNTQQTYSIEEDAQYGMSSAPATEQQIAGENAVDRTNVPGRYTPSPDLSSANGVATPGMPTAPAPVSVDAPAAAPTTEPAPAAETPVGDTTTTEELTVDETTETPTEDKTEEKENKILSKVKSSLPKKEKKAVSKRTAMNTSIINLASDVSDAIVAETEDVLEDAEETVKQLVPSHLATKALQLLEAELEEEGIEALFDKADSLSKTAGEEEDCTEEEMKEIVKKVAEAVVEDMEKTLAEADETMDEERETLADGEDQFELEAKLKAMVERKLHAKGIYTRFARTAKKAPKKTIAQKIREARKNR